MRNGWISRYEFYVSRDGKSWGDPLAKGSFQRDAGEKRVLFGQPCEVRFLRFIAVAGIENQRFASMAELDVIPAE